VNWRFSSSGVEAPGNTSVSPVAHVTRWWSAPRPDWRRIPRPRPAIVGAEQHRAVAEAQIAVGEFQRDRVILLEVEFDRARRRAAAGVAGVRVPGRRVHVPISSGKALRQTLSETR
jgi:hypothetical protein